ncbi:MAG: ABC-2 transporter permease [Coriobacteriia bacterium]
MKALILKDLLTLQKQLKTTAIMIAFFVVFALFMKSATYLTSMAVLFFAMLSVSSFGYDELARWEPYALSLPIGRRQIVGAKYALSLLLALAGALVGLVASLAGPLLGDHSALQEHLAAVWALFCVAVVFLSIITPLIYKFGVERSRIFVIAVFAVPSLLVYTAYSLGVPMPSEAFFRGLLYASPVLLFGFVAASFQLSCRIYEAKEF